MTNERRVLTHPDAATLTGSVAARFLTKATDLIEENGEVTVVLTGGTLGIAVLAAINESPARDSLDWSKVNVWWGDERWVERSSADRNEVQARAALLDHIPLDPERVHPFPAADDGIELDDAARSYARELAEAASGDSGLPRFDITFLGVGPDGHIASLFPDRAEISERSATVVAVRNSPKPPPERLSLTLPAINSSQRVWIVLGGADKAGALGLALADASVSEVPVAGARGRKRTLFFVDEAAAAEVPDALTTPGQFWTSADA